MKIDAQTTQIHMVPSSLNRSCPFCGFEPEFGYEISHRGMKRIKIPTIFCQNSDCAAQINGETREDAIGKWNQRQ